jgi:hypothetical protein
MSWGLRQSRGGSPFLVTEKSNLDIVSTDDIAFYLPDALYACILPYDAFNYHVGSKHPGRYL